MAVVGSVRGGVVDHGFRKTDRMLFGEYIHLKDVILHLGIDIMALRNRSHSEIK